MTSTCAAARRELEGSSAAYRERRAACSETRLFLTLLRAHRHKDEVELAVVREYARRLTKGVDLGALQQGGGGDSSEAPRREKRDVAALCEDIARRKCAIGGGGLDMASAHTTSEQIKKAGIPSDRLLSILCDQTAQGSTELLELESEPPTSEGKGGMRRVREMMGEMRKGHLKAFEETEARTSCPPTSLVPHLSPLHRLLREPDSERALPQVVRQETVETLAEASSIAADMDAILGGGQDAEVWRELLRQERELASARSAAAAVEGAAMELRGQLEDGVGAWEAVSKGQHEVVGLVQAVAEQQELAGMLLARNARRGRELREMQGEMREACKDGISDAVPHIRQASEEAVSPRPAAQRLFKNSRISLPFTHFTAFHVTMHR